MTLALGGMTLYRRPVGFVRHLLHSLNPPNDLTLVAFTAGYAADLLIGAGIVSKIRSCYVGLEAFGFAPMFTQFASQGKLKIIEETETSLVLGLRAAVSRVGSLSSRAWQGTDLFNLRPDVQSTLDPYTGESLTAFPAIHVDVSVIHALEVDHEGNAAINNNLAIDHLLIYAANTVIVTAERRVDRIQPAPYKTIIPARAINHTHIIPNGAAPTSCYPLYPMRGREFVQYIEACAADGGFERYLNAWLKVGFALDSTQTG